MLDKYEINTSTPYSHRTNARYRGPIESNKLYGNINRDLDELFSIFNDLYDRLYLYTIETFEGGNSIEET